MKFALIGHPVAGSLSPVLFRAAYNGAYAYDLIDEVSFDDAWARASAYDGFNVTAPFKTQVPAMMPRCDSSVLLSGCANTVIPGECCYNTDIDGVLGALADGGFFVPDGGRALVVGSGGAALAAWAALSPCMDVTFLARSAEKLCRFVDNPAFIPIGSPVPEADVVVYTLPSTAPVPVGLPLENAFVLEAEYKAPQLAGLCPRYISGRRWLLHQAVRAYELFTGESPDLKAMEAAL